MKQPTPKLDRLRELREARYADTHPPRRTIAAVKADVAAVPVKKQNRKKRL